jgi:D-glycero-D-manno-heptose 1,7-bisphosphate phosphatase
MAEKRRAVFLDRDGTINVEKEYLSRPEDFEFLPGVPEALKRLKDAGFFLIVVTNQSGVARGYFTLAEVEALHRCIQKRLRAFGTEIDGFFVCPHHPDLGVGEYRKRCACRKGEPGLLLQAAVDFGIDLSRSYMIGDKPADMEAGTRAGCRPILVLTGYGIETARKLKSAGIPAFDSLDKAADFILFSKK